MGIGWYNPGVRLTLATLLFAGAAGAQSSGTAKSQGTVNAAPPQPVETASKASAGVLVDQVIAVVNGDLVLESDVEEERRFSAFQPYTAPNGFSRDEAINRLIDRDLILQQAKLQPDDTVTVDDAKAQLEALRKEIPACKQYRCETDAGWTKFVKDQGFTVEQLTTKWRERMQVLKFVEMRFRMGIRITPEEIKKYYDGKMLPEYKRRGVVAPALDAISDRIQEVLLQEQVSALLGDWLQSLKVQGTVRMMRPGEVQP